eukprot:TRINITY_DN9948_c0_g1_i1.p1 TRINITY_DN9948_c0_g1~~TRINITY_DN9948_c0_g1_i1.p1  ORF type:complete len:110 (-),score=27.30 TRINITY_DN9948_c0_g1_i1:130-423(-)
MIRRPPRSTLDRSSAASDVYKRQVIGVTSIAIVSTILVTIFETIRNLKDNNPDNDYLVYILIAACLFQSVLFAFYTMYFIKYMIWKEEGNVSYLVPI